MNSKRLDFLLSSNMKYGVGEFEKLPFHLKEMDFSNPAVIIDNSVIGVGYVKNVLDQRAGVFKKCEILVYELKGEPTYDYLDECSDKMRKHKDIEVIVGIGGGSAIDLAKGIAVLMTNPGNGLNYRGFPKGINRPTPVVAIPTTAGTGSEATYNAVFTDTRAGKKLGINTTMNFPVLSILDPKLISTCPKTVIASSGMDALTHALESFVSRKATPISRMFSVEAMKLLIPSLEKVPDPPVDLEINGDLQLGAYLAGIALINSSSGPAGALSYLLGTWYKVPHGIAGSVFLPYIHRFNYEKGYYDYKIIFDAVNGGVKSGKEDKEKAGWFIDKIIALNGKFGINGRLSNYGVTDEALIKFEESVVTLKAAFDFNPVEIKREDMRRLLHEIF